MSGAPRSARRSLGAGLVEAFVLGGAALWLFAPFATWPGLVASALGAVAGALGARHFATTRVRLLAPPLLALVAFALLALGVGLVQRFGALAALAGPERLAGLADATRLGGGTLLATGVIVFFAERVRWLRPLPALAVIGVAAWHLLPHRGGAINRPLAVSDLAWLYGHHPALLFGAIGAAAGLLASFALLRVGTLPRAIASIATLALLALALLFAYPAIGVFAFSDEDPLSLAGRPGEDERGWIEGTGGEREAPSGRRGARDALGLRGGGEGDESEGPREPAPFLDDYSSSGANVPVAVVLLHDDVEPSLGVFYFRQVAFSRFNGRRLVRSLAPGVDEDVFNRFPSLGVLELGLPAGSEGKRRVVPSTVNLMRDHFQPPVMTEGVRLAPADNPDPSLFRRSYRADAAVLVAPPLSLLGQEAGDPWWPDEVREHYLRAPDDPRYHALAEEIVSTIADEHRDDPWARTIAILLWLERNTQYSLRSKHAGASDPTASFLFGSRIGYCVHLAHATAYLARALGVPARVSAGYAYAAADRAGGSALLLRAGDAHAWAEVYLDETGWVPVDPSPPSIDPPMAQPDLDLQQLLGERARESEMLEAPELVTKWRPPTARELLALVLAALLAWFVSGHAIKTWRRLAPRFRGDADARLAYRAALDRLAEAGATRRAGESREAFASRSAALSPSLAPLTEAHLAARFGARPAVSAEARRLAALVGDECALRLGARVWLGRLHPWSWRKSR